MAAPNPTSAPAPTLTRSFYASSWEALERLPIAPADGPFLLLRVGPEAASPDDPELLRTLDDMAVRGRAAAQRVFDAEGGLLSGQELGAALGISRQAVDKRRRAGTLLALRWSGRSYSYPAWQVWNGQTLPGLERVLASLNARDGHPIGHVVFFLTSFPRLGDQRPIDVLRRGTQQAIDDVEHAAAGFMEQGAA